MSEPNSAESNHNRLFWGASQLFLLGLVSRFHRNYRRFSQPESSIAEPVDRHALLELTQVVLYKQRVYLNVIETDGTEDNMDEQISALLLLQQISDHLDDLHVRLLEHDPDLIAPLIPELDRQRKSWKWDQQDGSEYREHKDAYSSFIHWKDELNRRL